MKRGISLMGYNTTMSEFYCTLCGRQGLPVWRRNGRAREAGHLKKLFCLYCGKPTNHAEIKQFTKYDFEQFKEEFEYGNFDEQGNRIRPYGEFRGLMHNGNIEKQKTLGDVRDSSIREDELD